MYVGTKTFGNDGKSIYIYMLGNLYDICISYLYHVDFALKIAKAMVKCG